MSGQPIAPAQRRFVPPELPSGSEAARKALATISEAVSRRSAEMHSAYLDAPTRVWFDAMMDTVGVCEGVERLAAFLGVEVPPPESGLHVDRRLLRAGRGAKEDGRPFDPPHRA